MQLVAYFHSRSPGLHYFEREIIQRLGSTVLAWIATSIGSFRIGAKILSRHDQCRKIAVTPVAPWS